MHLTLVIVYEIIFGLFLSYFFFNYIDNNSYLVNVIIYAVANFFVKILTNNSGDSIIFCIISSIITGLMMIKIMEITKSKTDSFIIFYILNESIWLIITLLISFIYGIIYAVFMAAFMFLFVKLFEVILTSLSPG